ncbi:MAG: helix-turn-helix transcriptional regulator, partial [Lentisphaeria bacterium]|nr:helix-turn-helix transcriptional regulator [Lentisphaeria bacterium]
MNENLTGKFIKELRKSKDLSQNQLADMIPISRQAISKWE